jgi:hypothetical protein
LAGCAALPGWGLEMPGMSAKAKVLVLCAFKQFFKDICHFSTFSSLATFQKALFLTFAGG